MFSKNNALNEKIRKMETNKNRFSIRKFTFGVTSALIGWTILGG